MHNTGPDENNKSKWKQTHANKREDRTHLEGLEAVSKGFRVAAFPGPDGGVVAARQQAGDTLHTVARDLVPGGLRELPNKLLRFNGG